MLRSIRFATSFADVFPHGFFAQSVEPVNEFDESRRRGDEPRQEMDKDTGLPLWAVRGIDGDLEAVERRQSEVKVKIAAATAPELPPPGPGFPFPPIEFAGLSVTPYLDRSRCRNREHASSPCRGRVAYSMRATALRPLTRTASSSAPARGSGGPGAATAPAA
jgi:hypothetical protein